MSATGAVAEALSRFDEAREAFTAALDRAPDESLAYLKPGDDYALGGLVFHVDATLEHYEGVLDAIAETGFGSCEPRDRPGLFEEANRRARAGMGAAERAEAMAASQRLHQRARARLASFGEADWERKAPVLYGPGTDPYPTSPADVAGWLTDHYLEHAPQVEQLLAEWRGAR
jgi:tetratricopeptide (TPR) repeat protein